MNEQYLKNVMEAALLAAGRPVSIEELVSLLDERDRAQLGEVRAALDALAVEYEGRGIELREVASGFRIQIRTAISEPVSRLWQERPTRYSRAFLETVALIAYRQPITRGEIEQIRGVAVNPNIIKSLQERSWVRVVGHRDVPGRPELLGTTRDFLDYFGLKKLDDLPTLAQLKELEDLRLQLDLPGAQPAVLEGVPEEAQPAIAAFQSDAELDAIAQELADEASDDEPATDADQALRGGLVARGREDDGVAG